MNEITKITITDEQRQSIADAIAQAIGEAYDCTRVWTAWGYGTMGPDDFVPVAEDAERVAEIADAVVEVVKAQIIRDLLAELERVEKWKEAVIDACVVSWVLKKEHENNPHMAVADLCSWCHSVALDPKVSSEAKALHGRIAELECQKNGWISIDDARFPLMKYKGDEIIIRTKADNYRWVYQVAIVDDDGKVAIDPCVMCSQCGGAIQWKPMEWKPLGKFIDADRSAAHAKAHAEDMYQRALKAEELLYRFYIDRDKKAEEAILNFVQDGLDKEGLL